MSEIPSDKPPQRIVRRWVITVVCLAVLVAVFYAEEDWRGKRAWDNCQRELAAKGMVLDWNACIPPNVPEEQNLFKAHKMTEWFVKNRTAFTNDLLNRLQSANTALTASVSMDTNLIATTASAADYLVWSDQFEPDFALIRAALQRPYARMDGDYSNPDKIPLPNFITVRIVAQMLAQRAHCYLLLNQPEKALRELTLLNDSRRLLQAAPSGKPMTMVAAMINVAVAGVYIQTVAEGLQRQAWQNAELVTLQEQLAGINLAPFVIHAFEFEPAAVCRAAPTIDFRKMMNMFDVVSGSSKRNMWQNLWRKVTNLNTVALNLAPRGWIYQNMANFARATQKIHESLFDAEQLVTPQRADQAMKTLEMQLEHAPAFNLLSSFGIPNYSKALQTFARNQTHINESQIVCALERHHYAHGDYPAALDALMPEFIGQLPPDLIGGQPLRYLRTSDGKFLLYSVGWNEKDDGGESDNRIIDGKDDWAWQYPFK
ncbi:MAG: hypothetical protein WCS42_00790 [Verrucomicrobiota bacterium]